MRMPAQKISQKIVLKINGIISLRIEFYAPFFSQSIPHNNGFFDIIKSYELEQKGSFA